MIHCQQFNYQLVEMSEVGKDEKKREIKVPASIKEGWFSEVEPMWPGQKLSLALEVS